MGPKPRGVALLEVLVSVSILAFGLGATMQAIRTCVRTQSHMRDRIAARQLAERQLATFLQQGSQAIAGHMSGAFETPFGDFSWSSHAYAPAGESPFVFVEFEVWKGNGDKKRLAYTTHVLIPATG
ncbi:MAG: hypothetical protein JXR94_20100 [Candidatus Hydrogenedentes bacterium]|nr:hypothetical protein [Candidatus Hydrogenedentota bacterium]